MAKVKGNAPKAAATAKGTNAASLETNEAISEYHVASKAPNESVFIFEHVYRGTWWRVQLSNHKGQRYLNFRVWLKGPNGSARPTKTGFVMREDRAANLIDVMAEALNKGPF